ncbi:glycosyltransferase [Pendulispora rubella]|uniref:Glycosyltransferase n=1 Tax=Pendulispora rubella TaxID=2741070 RepID=A0ABZ2LDN5_9BACT
MKIAFHAINGVGLGHLVRVLALANEVRGLVPGVKLLVVTNARDTSALTRARIDFVAFPPRLHEPHADPGRVDSALPPALEEAALLAVFETFAPDLVVFDTHAPMSVVRQLRGPRTVLVLRELRPEALRAFVASGAPAWFDRIVVPHDPEDVDMPLEGVPVSIVGHVVSANALVALNVHAGAPGPGTLVVAMAGGGGQPLDAARYTRAVADAHLLARARVPALETVLVLGPYGEIPAHVEDVPGLSIRRAVADLPGLLARAQLVISQAGYNAIAEIRALARPAIVIPGFRKAEDQRARARRLVRTGAAVMARPEARSIADRIEALLSTPGALEAMRRAHEAYPLVPRNRDAAEAVLRPVWRGAGPLRRAVLVAHDFAPRVGGMETVARALAEGLLARGVEVRVYTMNRLGAATASGLPAGVVRPLYAPPAGGRGIDLEADLLTTIDAALEDAPDVIHLCHAGLGPWVPELRAVFPSVVTAHVHGNDLLAPWVHHGREPDAYRAALIEGLSGADAVLCVSHFSAQAARDVGVSPERLQVVENHVDADRFAPGPRDEALARRLGVQADDEVWLTVSRLAPRKGHRTVLRALAAVASQRPRLKYVFTGESDERRAELLAYAASLGLGARVVAAGFVAEEELPALFRLADVFILVPDGDERTDVEGFGVALLEAAASGIPAIATSVGGVPEALEDGVSGVLVPKGDDAALARAALRFLEDRELAKAVGARARARVTSRFSQVQAVERVVGVWEARLQGARPTRPGPSLVHAAREQAGKRRRERTRRLDVMKGHIARGKIVRLRAMGTGARLLPDALADCATLGHAPRVEMKLRRFLDADFAAYALPSLESVELVHGVPHALGPALLEKVRRLPDAALAKVRSVRIFLTTEARERSELALSAVTEAHAMRKALRERGVLVVPPPELMRYMSEVPAGGPETGMIEPTNLCNLECPTCPTGKGKIAPRPPMTLRQFDDVIGALAPRMKNVALWNYGEPLLHRELPAMIARAKSAGVRVVKVSSNVHFLNETRGQALLGSGLDVLILSVDGASQETYATFRKGGDFAKVKANVAWLCAEKKRRNLAKPRIELQFIAMRHNEHELPEMRRLAHELGVDRLRIKTVNAEDDESRHLVPKELLLSRYRADGRSHNRLHPFCTMAWDHTVVNVDGSVTPCCYLRPDMGAEFVMGNVFETSFAEIWRGEKYRAFRAAMLDGRAAMPVCGTCRGGTHDLVAAVEEVSAS